MLKKAHMRCMTHAMRDMNPGITGGGADKTAEDSESEPTICPLQKKHATAASGSIAAGMSRRRCVRMVDVLLFVARDRGDMFDILPSRYSPYVEHIYPPSRYHGGKLVTWLLSTLQRFLSACQNNCGGLRDGICFLNVHPLELQLSALRQEF
jgi:hypothetical protein